ncbi:MAG: peptidase domain-containing ABC transporter [Glaciecola sp.]|jgi:ATP-binding cassette subfamily B protein RaxB
MQNNKDTSLYRLLRFTARRKVNLVLQAEASECALACLTMVANYHGNAMTIDRLRLTSQISIQGSDLSSLLKQAAQLKLSGRALKTELHELSELKTPAVLHWNFNHFVVLLKVKKKYCEIADPAIGIRRVPIGEVSDCYTGIAVELHPTSNFVRAKANRQQKLKLSNFIKPNSGIASHLTTLLILSVLLQVFAIASPFYMQTVIDEVIVNSDTNLLTVIAIAFVLLLLVDTCTVFLRDRIMLRFTNYLNLQMATGVFDHLLHLPVSYFQKRHLGDIVSRFSALQQVRAVLSSGIVTALIDGGMALLMLGVLFIYSPTLSLLVLSVLAIYASLRWALFNPMKRQQAEVIQSQANENTHFMQSVRAIKTIKLNNKMAQRHSQWLNQLATAMNKQITLARWNINFSSTNKALFGVENILVVYLAAELVMSNAFSIGMLYAFISYKNRFIASADSLVNKCLEFKMLRVHLDRLADIVLTPVESRPSTNESLPLGVSDINSQKARQSALEIHNLSFRYHESSPWVFQNISFSVPALSTVVIIGSSGSGKSTLFTCLMGLNKATKGSVRVNNLVLDSTNRHLQHFAAVMQDDQLLPGSVLDNITDFAERTDINLALKVSEAACLHEDVLGMTMQYNTLIGDMGSSLSGGQKQRLLLARALYKQPKVLFLDEASSHLDVSTEKRVNQALRQLNVTIIMIAHRPETIANADIVLSLNHGKLTQIDNRSLANSTK